MIYRREVDGLRAVAVIPVILFHAGFSLFGGGYAGVDIFFVISGYLITSILVSELERGDYSIARFYERRARRILPALFFVILCCMPFAWKWMPPRELRDFSGSVVAVIAFASNIQFWREEGYFAPSADLKPLLHTWSLAVEEQYYLLFPGFLWLSWRLGRKGTVRAIWVIAASSLVASEWASRHAPGANFYLLPTRAWELLAGSLCAFVRIAPAPPVRNFMSLAGLALIALAIFAFDETTPFPSLYALVPVAGTALVILFADAGTWTGKLLGSRPLVGAGLISYSAYLWHQPLLAFARVRSIDEPSPWLLGGLALLSLPLAYLTWRFVEQPFRRGVTSLLPSRGALFATSGAVAAAFALAGLAGHFANGFEARFSGNVLRYDAAVQDGGRDLDCFFKDDKLPQYHPQPQCLFGDKARVDTMLIGDSHMWALHDALRGGLGSWNFYYVAYGACPPVPGFTVYSGADARKCDKLLKDTYAFADRSGIKTIVLAGRYLAYLDGGYDNGEGGEAVKACAFADLAERTNVRCLDPSRRARVLVRLGAEIRRLAQRFKVVLVYPVPEAGWNVPNRGFKVAAYSGEGLPVTTSYPQYLRAAGPVIALFDRLSAELPNVYPARVQDVLCNRTSGRCLNADRDGVYYIDDNHLSVAGARLVAPLILRAMEDTRKGRPAAPVHPVSAAQMATAAQAVAQAAR